MIQDFANLLVIFAYFSVITSEKEDKYTSAQYFPRDPYYSTVRDSKLVLSFMMSFKEEDRITSYIFIKYLILNENVLEALLMVNAFQFECCLSSET